MTTGNTSFNQLVKTVDGFPFYHYGERNWTGGDSIPVSDYRLREPEVFHLKAKRILGNRLVTEDVEALRTRSVPKRLRKMQPNGYATDGLEMVQDDFEVGIANSGTWKGGFVNEPATYTHWDTNDEIALLGKLREAVAGSSFNAAVTSAEMKETLGTISSSATRLYKSIRHFRRGNFSRAADELFAGRGLNQPSKRAASNWLELKYGWLPLVNDVYEGSRFLAHNLAPRVFRVTVTKGAGGKMTRFENESIFQLPFEWGHVNAQTSHQESKRIIALLTEVDVPALAGLLDPLSVAWELVPYSFVADWFIPVGNYLSARALPQALSGTFITMHRKRTRLTKIWINQTSGNATMVWKKHPQAAHFEKYYFNRSVATNLSVPPLPNLKSLGSVPSWEKALTSVSLLVGLRK